MCPVLESGIRDRLMHEGQDVRGNLSLSNSYALKCHQEVQMCTQADNNNIKNDELQVPVVTFL